MQNRQCSNCQKNTLASLCSNCKNIQQKTNTASVEETRPVIKSKSSRVATLIVVLSTLITAVVLTQTNYSTINNSIANFINANPDVIEEEVTLQVGPPYQVYTVDNKNREIEKTILHVKCGNMYKPVIPLNIVESKKTNQTILIALAHTKWNETCDNENYRVTDGIEEIKSIKISHTLKDIELYAINIPVQGLTIDIKKNPKGKTFTVDNTATMDKTEILNKKYKTTSEPPLGTGTFFTINSKTNKIEGITLNNTQVRQEQLCNTIFTC